MTQPWTVYTHGYQETVMRSYQFRTAQNSAAYLIEHLVPGTSLLDVGCGPGTITADLAALVAPGRVTAIDISAEMLAKASRTVADRDLDNVEFTVADVYALDYPDDNFGTVHAHQVLQHVADPVGALREMRRVCKPGGHVAARDADYGAMTWYPLIPALDEWLSLYCCIARHNGGEPNAGRRLLSWAYQAGFVEVRATASTWCYATAEERAQWGEMWAERIVGSDITEQAISYGYTKKKDLERISAGWRAWAAATDGWFAILHGEILCRA
jgi:ubiquinone/menaquinone biosynthesis C-methylase UbiE